MCLVLKTIGGESNKKIKLNFVVGGKGTTISFPLQNKKLYITNTIEESIQRKQINKMISFLGYT